MKKYALGIEYSGSEYSGWQRQVNADSVQSTVEKALSRVADHDITLYCAGRTDKGVHAIEQVVHFETSSDRVTRAWVFGSNGYLPPTIRINWAKQVPDDFHARYSAISRRYRYIIYNASQPSGLFHNRCVWIKQDLNIDDMQSAADHLLGQHDFSSFRASGCQARHPVREIKSIKISKEGAFVYIEVDADGFLYHMVRNIVGSLLKVGKGQAATSWIKELLTARDRTRAAATAPAHGLYFMAARYPEEYEILQKKVNLTFCKHEKVKL